LPDPCAFSSYIRSFELFKAPDDITDFGIAQAKPGLPDRNKKLSPNSLQKIPKLSQISPNFWKLFRLYKNINFFTGNQSFKALLSFALCFTRKRIDFQHYANIS